MFSLLSMAWGGKLSLNLYPTAHADRIMPQLRYPDFAHACSPPLPATRNPRYPSVNVHQLRAGSSKTGVPTS